MRSAALLTTFAILSGCSGESEAHTLRGVLAFGLEYRGFIECHRLDKSCVVQAMFSENECWVNYGRDEQPQRVVAEQLKKNGIEDLNLGARFLVEVEGSRMTGGDGFGHLGHYPCAVTLTQINSIEFVDLPH